MTNEQLAAATELKRKMLENMDTQQALSDCSLHNILEQNHVIDEVQSLFHRFKVSAMDALRAEYTNLQNEFDQL